MITHSFDELLNILKSRIAQIELNRELYTISTKYNEQDMLGNINVEYDGRHLVTFHYLQTNIRVDGRTTVRGAFTVKFRMYPDWYKDCIPQLSRDVVHIDEYFRLRIYNETFRFEECLDKYLPIGNEEEKEIIKNSLTNIGLRDVEVVFDTYQKTYLVKSNLHEFLDFQKNKEEENVWVYKYTSLETYRNILNHGTFINISEEVYDDLEGKLGYNNVPYQNMMHRPKGESYYTGNVISHYIEEWLENN